jgi:hypothetical protein
MKTINAISLWEPWATAMRLGLKTVETRGWPPPARCVTRPLLICGAKRWKQDQNSFLWDPRVRMAVKMAAGKFPVDMLLGMAACIVTLGIPCVTSVLRQRVGAVERMWGDYSNGRWGWQTSRLINDFKPFPVKGKQGIFQVEIPDELYERAVA